MSPISLVSFKFLVNREGLGKRGSMGGLNLEVEKGLNGMKLGG